MSSSNDGIGRIRLERKLQNVFTYPYARARIAYSVSDENEFRRYLRRDRIFLDAVQKEEKKV